MNMDIEALKKYFARREDVKFALVYGSFAKDRATPLSDLDVAVFLEPELGKEEMCERQIEITGDLMSLCRMNNVDVTILNLATPFLKFQIVKYGKLLKCRNQKEFNRFHAKVLGEYQDIKPMQDMYDELAVQELKNG